MTGPFRAFHAAALRRAALRFLIPLLALPAAARAADIGPVDFPEAVSRALKNNAALSAAGFEWVAAKRDADAARGALLPALTFEERFVRTNVPAEVFAIKIDQERLLASDFASVDSFNKPPPVNDFMTAVSVEQPLFAPRAYLGSRMAARESAAKELEVRTAKEDVIFRVLTAYLDVLSGKETVRAAEQEAADAREHQRIAEAMERSGTGLASDVLRAKVFLASAESRQVTAENRLSLAQRGLALAMGERGGTAVDVAAPLPPLPEDGSLDERIAAALARRSDLRAFALRVENAGTNVAFEKSQYLPALGVTGAYQLDGQDGMFSPDNRSWRVGVGLRWNLFDGFRREAAVARAAAESGRAKASFRGAQDDAAFQVARAYLAVREADRRVEIARSSLAAAEEGTRLIKARYANQLARMVDLLDAQSALDAARSDLVRAENDRRQSRARLLFESGTLLPWALPGSEEKP